MSPAEIVAERNRLYEEYRSEAAEARACGYEVPTFEEWAGATNPKAEAEARINALYDNDTWDLY